MLIQMDKKYKKIGFNFNFNYFPLDTVRYNKPNNFMFSVQYDKEATIILIRKVL